MTKEMFRRFAEEAIRDMMDVPDDAWEHTHPMCRIKVGREVVVVGLEADEESPP